MFYFIRVDPFLRDALRSKMKAEMNNEEKIFSIDYDSYEMRHDRNGNPQGKLRR